MLDDLALNGEAEEYSYGFLDEQTKRMIRRAILKAVSIPGYQVPFGDREIPLPPGWGTGGIQVTASIIGKTDCLKVIDQGADDTTNAVSIRRFFARVARVNTTESTGEATIVQSRHRIPERPLQDDQILVMQVPQPEPLRRLVTSEVETRKLHAFARYGLMQVRLYEDIARYGNIVMSHDYPVRVHDRYLASPSPVPKFDNPKLHRSRALTIFGAGRERRIYAIPPFTDVRSIDFDDHPFERQKWQSCCARCGAEDSYLDEMLLDDAGNTQFVCSDTSYCNDRLSEGASR
ncbi:alpha-D-ribose 1-methylphosphonate 5-phosphate C-P-lyase PhnJ [Mesorhizobium retamae]|uniref:Alpha-D-ribose 1-methylphosphonate 5-phosphate C-P lyase n=1 Tax=Mesorhizobium retamae TaxID=2912854 RepID=A0ABS9QF56_9HYPH|nr:alpha-D-ribose 1-methylphosphonate 5-phosphate C-P-lyase PhnJ [Mesorhizobium sp. IRAMC:0171]MCG7505431.1 alpha-D-ribose 1-methylphosphonate 5-phosphate C-P-lyase PhnJ [Mesorhizobium sp. IRAMC:0171]